MELEIVREKIQNKYRVVKTDEDLEWNRAIDLCTNIINAHIKHMNDGWIPSKKHLPKAPEMEDEYPEFNVMIEGAKTPTTLQYSYDGVWIDDYGNVYNVIAWRPLPESYIPKIQDAKNNYEPDWKRNFRKKFERRM